jgi:hypothetical protein
MPLPGCLPVLASCCRADGSAAQPTSSSLLARSSMPASYSHLSARPSFQLSRAKSAPSHLHSKLSQTCSPIAHPRLAGLVRARRRADGDDAQRALCSPLAGRTPWPTALAAEDLGAKPFPR